jgi:hypothetical protein
MVKKRVDRRRVRLSQVKRAYEEIQTFEQLKILIKYAALHFEEGEDKHEKRSAFPRCKDRQDQYQ